MNRWESVTTTRVNGADVRMYRERYRPAETTQAASGNMELDHNAQRYLGSELLMYKIMDTNWTAYMENRGDVSRMPKILIPVRD